MSERFYVREHSGYGISFGATAGNASLNTEWMVIDREYYHRVVRSFPPRVGPPRAWGKWQNRHTRQRLAYALCASLNEQEREQS